MKSCNSIGSLVCSYPINIGGVLIYVWIPNDGPVDLPLSFTFSGELAEDHPHCPPDGWNLLGNPYPSALDWDKVEADMDSEIDIDHGLYMWNPNINQYATYINGITANQGSNRIAAFQGFFIRATGSDTLKLRNSHRTVDSTLSTTFFRKKNPNSVKIKVEFSGRSDETAIYTNSEASYEYDLRHDGYKMFSNDKNTPQIYTTNDDNIMYSINGLPENPHKNIKLCLVLPQKGNCTISVPKINWNNKESYPILYDNENNTFTDLSTNPYTFWAEKKVQTSRFTIVFKQITTGISEEQKSESNIYIIDDKLFVNFIEGQYENLSMHNIQGETVCTKNMLLTTSTFSLNTGSYPAGIYFVNMTGKSGSVTHKILLK